MKHQILFAKEIPYFQLNLKKHKLGRRINELHTICRKNIMEQQKDNNADFIYVFVKDQERDQSVKTPDSSFCRSALT